ncbi:MAG: hypothetical protein A2X42_01875 [Candidatus Margulisbacteria bacterium GWF2_38_17]|nr:MAG: hypothetical protein A2X42_01875 [Candidatus Margulisbacteria bacterium GWF2_38_17]
MEVLNHISTTYNHEIFNALQPILTLANIHIKKSIDPQSKQIWETILSSLYKIEDVVKAINKLAYINTIPRTEYIEGIEMIDIKKILSAIESNSEAVARN